MKIRQAINYIPKEQITSETLASKPQKKWVDAFIPETSEWGEKPLCEYDESAEYDENIKCCSSGYDIEAIVEQAYEDGIGDHPGVKAIEDRPCVSDYDLETLADELAHVSFLKLAKEEEAYEQQLAKEEARKKMLQSSPIPEGLDPNSSTKVIKDNKVLLYCADLVHRTLTKSYGGEASIPEKQIIPDKFNSILRYCSTAMRRRVNIVDLIQNTFINKVKDITTKVAHW